MARADRGVKGVLLVDKPAGMTSHDVVNRIRRAAQTRRVGHTGTLDPAATGLLILCIGPATRLSEFLTGLDKTYEGTMRLGITTDSYDLDGVVQAERSVPELDAQAIQDVCNRFIGAIQQVPPMVSAVKVDGERLYRRARKGEIVEREPRNIHVHEFSVLSYEAPDARFRLRCSSGAYARSLCHEVGELIGCGAALAGLRRTAVGRHTIDEATPLDQFDAAKAVSAKLVPMGAALDLPRVVLIDAGVQVALSGGVLDRRHFRDACPVDQGWVQLLDHAGDLVAVGEALLGARVQPRRVLRERD